MQNDKSIYGLVGYPVEHSLSPLMHNVAFSELDVDAEYKLFPLKEDELDVFFNGLREESSPIFGLNVTVPYKEKVIKYLDSLTPFAQKIMAVNTVVISKDRKLIGYNTDGPGFLAHLAELGFDAGRKRVSILGAGGAARAIVSAFCLASEKPESILIYDTEKDKAARLVSGLKQRFDVGIVKTVGSLDDLNLEIVDLLINATPIGMKEGDPCLVEEDLLRAGMLVYDLVYNPKETALLKAAKKRGAKVANGLGMLYYQGVLAFQHWADTQIDDRVKNKMREVLEGALN